MIYWQANLLTMDESFLYGTIDSTDLHQIQNVIHCSTLEFPVMYILCTLYIVHIGRLEFHSAEVTHAL